MNSHANARKIEAFAAAYNLCGVEVFVFKVSCAPHQ